MFKKEKLSLDRVRQGRLHRSICWSVLDHCFSLVTAMPAQTAALSCLLSFRLACSRKASAIPEVDLFLRKAKIFEGFSWISRRLCGLTCMTNRRSSMRWSSVHVSWACGWFNNAVVRAWIGQSLSLPWLFSRQTKLKETSRLPGSDLEEGESVWQSEYLRDASWASETESPQTDNEWGCSQRAGWKRDRKKITWRCTPWKKNSWFIFLDCLWTWSKLYIYGACMSTSAKCATTVDSRTRVRVKSWTCRKLLALVDWSSISSAAVAVRRRRLLLTRFSCILGMDRKKALVSLTGFETKMKCAYILGLHAPAKFCGVIVHMPFSR